MSERPIRTHPTSPRETKLRWPLWGLGIALLGASLMAFGMTLLIASVVAASVGLLQRRAEQVPNFLTLAASFFVMALMAEVALRLLPFDPQYYRPAEMLVGGEGEFYEPNRAIEGFESPHGDIGGSWPGMPSELRTPRVVDFVTDSRGFRNRADYAGEPFIIAGDSFVAGNGSDQEDTLAAVLTGELGVSAYGAGYPADPDDYPRHYRAAIEGHPEPGRAVVLIFEGNDLPCAEDLQSSRRSRGAWYNYVPGEFRRLEVYRTSYGLVQRAYIGMLPAASAPGFSRTIDGEEIAFLRRYANASKAATGDACEWEPGFAPLAAIADEIALLVFVPTKYRTYAPLIEGELEAPLPRFRPDFVAGFAAEHDIPYLDLTPIFTEAGDRLVREGRLLYWRDDTHWGPDGVRVAAQEIAARL